MGFVQFLGYCSLQNKMNSFFFSFLCSRKNEYFMSIIEIQPHILAFPTIFQHALLFLLRKLKKHEFISFCQLQQIRKRTKPIWVLETLKSSKYIHVAFFMLRKLKNYQFDFCMLKFLKICENMWLFLNNRQKTYIGFTIMY